MGNDREARFCANEFDRHERHNVINEGPFSPDEDAAIRVGRENCAPKTYNTLGRELNRFQASVRKRWINTIQPLLAGKKA